MQSELTWAKANSKASGSADLQPQMSISEQRRNVAHRLGFPHWPLKNVRAVRRPTQVRSRIPCKVADGRFSVVPVWWKQGKAVDDDKALSFAVNIGHVVLGGLDGVVDMEEEEGKGEPMCKKWAKDCNHH
eukprot:1700842-Amphidinium_carterae.1